MAWKQFHKVLKTHAQQANVAETRPWHLLTSAKLAHAPMMLRRNAKCWPPANCNRILRQRKATTD
jgi:hypothetical protein